MRRILLSCLLMILIATSLFALSNFYMAPYGATMVNLDNSGWSRVEISTDSGNVANSGSDNIFPNERIIFLGGLENLRVQEFLGYEIINEAKDFAIRLEFNSATWDGNYFWFTKQSDPEFKRPFQIQIGYRVIRDGALRDNKKYADLGFVGESSDDILDSIPEGLDDFLNALASWADYDIGFEFGIVLPGTISNGILSLNNESYPIATGIDYSAEINITATLTDIDTSDDTSVPEEFSAPINFTVSIGGYYDPRYSDGTENPDVDTSASLYVTPYARAANIDLLNDQGKTDIPIANVDFSIYDLPENFTSGQYDESVFIFLSANSNPFGQDEKGFRFVHESVGFGDAELPTNSLGYTITASGTSDTTANDGSGSVTFDGTDYLTPDGSNPDHRILTAHHEMAIGDLFGGGKAHWHSWNGELILSLDTNNRIMNEGLYRSTVYVHVVTDDSLGGVV